MQLKNLQEHYLRQGAYKHLSLIHFHPLKIMINSETTDKQTATELFEELAADGVDTDEMQEFIDEHGHKDFVLYFEDYQQAVEEWDKEIVDSFIEEFELSAVDRISDAYHGSWRNGAEFAEQLVQDCGYINNELPYWIEVDWEKTWDNLSYDYTEINGYIFSNNF